MRRAALAQMRDQRSGGDRQAVEVARNQADVAGAGWGLSQDGVEPVQQLQQALVMRDNSLLGVVMNVLLAWPDCAFRLIYDVVVLSFK